MSRIRYVEQPGPVSLPGVMEEEFVLVDSAEQANFVNQRLNAGEAKSRKRMRLKHLRENGEVNEVLMPDTYRELVSAAREIEDVVGREAREIRRQLDVLETSFPYGPKF